jgi:pyruvate kinase
MKLEASKILRYQKSLVKKTKLIATIGPKSQDPLILRKLFDLGVDICRLNFSHADHSYH